MFCQHANNTKHWICIIYPLFCTATQEIACVAYQDYSLREILVKSHVYSTTMSRMCAQYHQSLKKGARGHPSTVSPINS
ncbi:hypothetical protein PISMIDRAFT_116998 [Pisolithus microcarpus 441]|uniref:Secreted protein n=1 Tax=Pisolithus microcarpus 441 TaxID=765257 RepID=A0A0C9YKY6_9AGAM|nr:hypothetical protein PISMIDRAFT_116998 [Pisolithus microcarpus 441]